MKQKRSDHKLRPLSIAIVLLVVVVSAGFLLLIYRITSTQTMKMGNQQLLSMSKEVNSLLSHAEYEVNELAETVESFGNDMTLVRNYIEAQSELQYKLSDGDCFRVCYTTPGCIIVPGEQIDNDFDLSTRDWYNGAVAAGPNAIFISAPYADLFKGKLCFSVARLLSDGVSTVSLDYTLTEIQQYLSELSAESGEAILVNSEGLIVGANIERLNGSKLEQSVPNIVTIWNKMKHSNQTYGYFTQGGTIYFYNVSEYGWYLIYSVNDLEMHGKDYLIMSLFFVLLIVVFVVVYYLMERNRRNRRLAEEALHSREVFFANLKGEFKYPLDQINRMTQKNAWEENIEGNLAQIREATFVLNRLFDNLLAYSVIQNDEAPEADKEEKNIHSIDTILIDENETVQNTKVLGRVATTLLLVLIPAVIIFSTYTVHYQGRIAMNNRTEMYYGDLQEWVTSRKDTVDMMVNMLNADSTVLKDYDRSVAYLNQIAQQYEGISLIYIGNENSDHPIVMSDGWTGDGSYVVQAYSWYANARSATEGYEISSVHYDIDSRQYVITFSKQMVDKNGKFIGVLGVDFNVSDLVASLESKYSNDEYAFLVTHSGAIMNHPNEEYKISYSDVVNIDDSVYKDAQFSEEISVFLDYDKRPVISMHRAESISGFQIYVVRTWTSIYGAIVLSAFVFVGLIVVSLCLIFLIWKKITKWREETTQKLEIAVSEAYDANQAKSRFLAQMSHEIRTPINAVLGMNEMILRESEDPSILSHATDIKKAGKILLLLVNSILDFSKIENGNDEIVLIQYDTASVVDELVSEITPLAREHGLELITKVDDSIPGVLFGDRVKIVQIISNLLTNAVKYTPQGNITLEMSSEKNEDGSVQLKVSVIDTGIGIKEEDRSLLFKTFQRLDMEKNHSIEGTGLGLYIVKHYLEKMGSTLSLESVYGEGSTFSFAIRQEVIDETPMGAVKAKQTHEEEHQKYLYAPNVCALVVDDNEMNRKVAMSLLKRSKMMIDLAESGEQCIEMVKEKTYDIILLDQMMPNMNGVETLHTIRKDKLISKDTPVIIMTAHAIAGAREQYLKAGFQDYISKPIDSTNLEQTLFKWIPEGLCDMVEKKPKDGNTAAVTKKEAQKTVRQTVAFQNPVLNEIQNVLEEMDLKNGYISCGEDEDLYLEILTMFVNLDIKEELAKFRETGDFKNYCISIHGFKNNAYSVGLQEMGDLSYRMEEATREKFGDTIDEMQQTLFEKYDFVCSILREKII